MSPKAFLVGESTRALRAASAYERVVAYFVKRAEIAAHMLDLPDDELARATFLLATLKIGEA